MFSTGLPTWLNRADLRAVTAVGFATLAVVAAGNAAAMFVFRARGYGTLPLAAAAALYAATAAWCAVRVRAGRRAGQARAVRGPVTAWVVGGCGVWLTLALTYHPGAMFWTISAATLAAWGAAGVRARRRLRGGTGGRQRSAAPPAAPNGVRAGAPDVGPAGGPARAGVRSAVKS